MGQEGGKWAGLDWADAREKEMRFGRRNLREEIQILNEFEFRFELVWDLECGFEFEFEIEIWKDFTRIELKHTK